MEGIYIYIYILKFEISSILEKEENCLIQSKFEELEVTSTRK